MPFSDQLLDSVELRDRDAPDPGTNPVELPDRDELLENDFRSLLLEYLLLENFRVIAVSLENLSCLRVFLILYLLV